MNSDGSDVRRLTETAATNRAATWSPDGRQIAFFSNRERSAGIFVMNADGSDQTLLTTDRACWLPSWSPDGASITFNSSRVSPQNVDIYVMAADGSNQIRLTEHRAVDESPNWGPVAP